MKQLVYGAPIFYHTALRKDRTHIIFIFSQQVFAFIAKGNSEPKSKESEP